MKIPQIRSFCLCFFLLILTAAKAQDNKAEIAIKSSVMCEICTKKIESALSFKGIEKVTVDLQTKIITVSYNPQQTTAEKIKAAIVKTGYDADELKANPKAHKKLDKCCKKESQHP